VYDLAGNRTKDALAQSGGPNVGDSTTEKDATFNSVNEVSRIEMVQQNYRGPPIDEEFGPPPPPADLYYYDLDGNTTSRVYADGSSNAFEWDAANRLTAITYSGTNNRTEFTYNGLSHLTKIVEKTGTAVTSTKQFVWIGNRIAEERDADNVVTRRYYRHGE